MTKALYRQLRDAGLCAHCGEPSPRFSLCPGCAEHQREATRKRKGQTPWRPGTRGRPLVNTLSLAP